MGQGDAVLITILTVTLILAAMAAMQALCVRIDDRKFPAPGQLVRLHGHEMHVQRQGTGEPAVILEAGIAASSLSWSLTQPLLGAITATYSYDRSGFGWSTAQKRGCSLTRIADDLHDLINTLKVPRPYIIVAHSFGAYIATEYAQRFAEELAGVVLVDPLTPEEWVGPTPSQRWMLRRGIWFSRVGGVLEFFGVVRCCLWLLDRGRLQAPQGVLRLFGSKATETVGRILGELLKLPPETVRLIRARWSTPRFFWTMAAYIQAVPRCARELHQIKIPARVPVTVLSGAHQTQDRLREHASAAEHSKRGRHVIASRSAHWIHLDQPELVAQAVREMVEGCTMLLGPNDEEGCRARTQ